MNPNKEVIASATDWFIKLQEPSCSQQDRDQWLAWITVSPDHQKAFQQVEETWLSLEQIPEKKLHDVQSNHSDGMAEQENVVYLNDYQNPQKPPVDRKRWGWAASIAASLLIAITALNYFGVFSNSPTTEVYVTQTAEHENILLQDGSTLFLGAETRINSSYSDTERSIELISGEAYFDAATDEKRPFVVDLALATVTVTGTEFNIKNVEQKAAVTVTEGHVRVESPLLDSPVDLHPGDQLFIDSSGETNLIQGADVAYATSWTNRVFQYQDTALNEVIADFNRYSNNEVFIKEPHIQNIRFSGNFIVGEEQKWLDALSSAYQLDSTPIGKNRILLRSMN